MTLNSYTANNNSGGLPQDISLDIAGCHEVVVIDVRRSCGFITCTTHPEGNTSPGSCSSRLSHGRSPLRRRPFRVISPVYSLDIVRFLQLQLNVKSACGLASRAAARL